MTSRVALICNQLTKSLADNLSKAEELIHKAAKSKANFVCFGEYALQGKEEDDYRKDLAARAFRYVGEGLC